MQIDGVFAGGGVRAVSFIGALQALEKQGHTFNRVAGTSAGAIISALIIAGYSSEEIYELIERTDLKTFLDPRRSIIPTPLMKWIRTYWRLGLFKGEKLEQWLADALQAKGISTFADLPKGSLRIIASDLTRGRIIVLPNDLSLYGIDPESFSVAKAVRMSSSIPYLFEPVKLYDRSGMYSVIVDGGVLSNFPIWLFADDERGLKRPVIGFQLSPVIEDIPPRQIKNALQLFYSLFETMRTAHDLRHIKQKYVSNIVFIPIDEIKTIDFQLTKEQGTSLIEMGREKTEEFLKDWTF